MGAVGVGATRASFPREQKIIEGEEGEAAIIELPAWPDYVSIVYNSMICTLKNCGNKTKWKFSYRVAQGFIIVKSYKIKNK